MNEERGKGYGKMLVERALKQYKHRFVRYRSPAMHSEHIIGKVCRGKGYQYTADYPEYEGTYRDGSVAYRCILDASPR